VLLQVAHYLLVAGSAARSAELYRTLLATHPDNADLLKGLGQAETAAGQYSSAQDAYLRAFRINSSDLSIRHDMELASALSAIDPSPRRLPSREKYGRSLRILRLVRDSVVACGSESAALADAERTVNLKHPDTSNEAAEQVLQLAEYLWRNRPSSCPAPEVLPVLMQKLAQ
jgi:tetratricopeptide (TPR) repeat protein